MPSTIKKSMVKHQRLINLTNSIKKAPSGKVLLDGAFLLITPAQIVIEEALQ